MMTDAEYIEGIKTGDARVLRLIYTNFLPRIVQKIRSTGGTTDDAKDIFQDALLVIYEKSKKADFRLTSSFYTLLYGICRNILGNRLQKRSSTNELAMPEDKDYKADDDIQELIQQEEQDKVFWAAFKKLGADCQQIMRLFFEKVKMAEIVERLGLSSVSYAKKHKFQCKEQLVKLVRQDARFEELVA